ncbi:hypothetical protein AB0C77_31665 [Streptomyces sp. NPDC048629]|uniref:hypothetical protein n=1 Tax=Streptomyces sp. NPDC048629 TaxID=3154824 RepID=UPI0034293ADC
MAARPRKPTRKTAARKPPVPRRTSPAPEQAVVASPAPGAREEADPVLADSRDRAADITALATELYSEAQLRAAADAADLCQAAEARAETIRRAAVTAARQVLAETVEETGDRLRRAETDADAIRTAAGGEAETILDEARVAAESEAAEILRQAEDQVQEVLSEVEERAAELAALRKVAADTAYRTALDDAAKIRGAAQEQANQAEAAVAAADAEVDLIRRRARLELDEELARRRKATDVEFADYRKEVEAKFSALGHEHNLAHQARIEQLDQELATMRAKASGEAKSITDRAAKDAQAVKTAAEREANRLTGQAAQHRALAEELLANAEAAARRTSKRRDVSQKVWKSATWIALAAGVGLAASGEFSLAKLVGFHEAVAPLFPLSVDIYAIVAFKKKKDVGPALSIMAASNLAYHLAERGGVHDPGSANGQLIVLGLTALVVLTFVTIIWRVHHLLDGGHSEPAAAQGSEDDALVRTADRTDEDRAHRTADRTEQDGNDRTGDRTDPDRTPRTEDRTGADRTARTEADRTPRTPKPRTARTAKTRTGSTGPVRTDAECKTTLQGLPRTDEGFVTVNAARTTLGCNRDRAVRLLDETGLLSPADRAKHLMPAR